MTLPIEVKSGDVVCLCGSTRFKEKFLEIKSYCQSLGALVLIPEVFKYTDDLELSSY